MKCRDCGDEYPDFDVAHVCSSGKYAPGYIQEIARLTKERSDLVLEVEIPVRQRDKLVAALEECRQAFDFTRQYVGEEMLPAIKGWSWFDADTKAREALASVKGE